MVLEEIVKRGNSENKIVKMYDEEILKTARWGKEGVVAE